MGPAGPRILVVDDDSAVRRVLVRFLRLKGCNVREAEHGLDGLELLRREQFDAIVSDISMPLLDGFGMWQAIRRERPGLTARVLFVSAVGPPEELARVDGARYMAKPFELAKLWSVLVTLLAGSEPDVAE
ncbi:MAG: response regulator [Gemmatimonadales bacterium]